MSLAGEPIEQKKNKYSWFIVPHLTIYILGVYHGRPQDLFQGEGSWQPGVGNTNFYIIFCRIFNLQVARAENYILAKFS